MFWVCCMLSYFFGHLAIDRKTPFMNRWELNEFVHNWDRQSMIIRTTHCYFPFASLILVTNAIIFICDIYSECVFDSVHCSIAEKLLFHFCILIVQRCFPIVAFIGDDCCQMLKCKHTITQHKILFRYSIWNSPSYAFDCTNERRKRNL